MDYKKLCIENNCTYYPGQNGSVHLYTRDPSKGTTWLIDQLKSNYKKLHAQDKGYVFGFDVEFLRGKVAATIQISTSEVGCLFHVEYMKHSFPEKLRDLLVDPTIIKAGVGIIGKIDGEGDKFSIQKTFNITMEGIIDVSECAKKSGLTSGYRGLDELAVELLGHPNHCHTDGSPMQFMMRTSDIDWLTFCVEDRHCMNGPRIGSCPRSMS
jgi:hypothetical protein